MRYNNTPGFFIISFFILLWVTYTFSISLAIFTSIIMIILICINKYVISINDLLKILPTRFYFDSIQYGKCECKIRLYHFKPIIVFSFDKVAKNTILKNDIFRFFKIHQTKYNKSIIVQGTRKRILLFYEAIKNNKLQFKSSKYILKNLIRKNSDLHFDYIDREEQEDIKKVEINSASIIQLSKVPFISIMDANKIKNHIKKQGEFQSLWEFAEFLKLEQNQTEILIKYVCVKSSDTNQQKKKTEIKIDNLLDI